MRILSLVLGLIFLAPQISQAKDIFIQTKVSSVNLHSDGALLTRNFDLDLPAGKHRLIFRDLTEMYDLGSAQFSFQTENIRIIGFGGSMLPENPNLTIVSSSEAKTRKALDEAISKTAELDQQVKALEARSSAAKAQIAYLTSLNDNGTKDKAVGFPDPASIVAASSAIGGAYLAALQEIAQADSQIFALERRIEKADAELTWAAENYANFDNGHETGTLNLTVDVAEKFVGVARVSYLTGEASWGSNYEILLRQNGAKGRVTIKRRAAISNRTGEIWSHVPARLFSSKIFVSSDISDPTTKIGRLTVTQDSRLGSANAPLMESAGPVNGYVFSGGAELGANPEMAEQVLTFDLPDDLDLSGTGVALISLDKIELDVDLSAKLIPRWNKKAFLIAKFRNTTGGPILAGDTFIFRDGAYIGQGSFNSVGIGEEIELSFGEYEGIEVRHVVLERNDGDVGIISSANSRTIRHQSNIISHLDFALPVRVLDFTPVSETEDLVIKIIAKPQPDERKVQGERGVVAWNFLLAPKQDKAIEFGYEAQWPKGMQFE